MISFFYDLALFIVGLIALPRLLWLWLRVGKYRNSFKARFGMNLPFVDTQGKKVIWIHTISVGETRAVISLFKEIKKEMPDYKVIISNITETGHAEAKRSMKEADAHFFLPLDFSFLIKKVVKKYHPDLLILVESDFWYHLLKYNKKVVLVNGKISERSYKRFQKCSFFKDRLFSFIYVFCVQTQIYKDRFISMGIKSHKIHVTGNLKFDQQVPKINTAEWKENLGITAKDRIVVIGSTHDLEEEWLLSAMPPVWQKIPDLKIILVPRHPERFTKVLKLLTDRGVSTLLYSKRAEKTGKERVVLVDAMGLLNPSYQLAEVAIVAGSFISTIGGHNVFEPAVFGVPVLFGPHMFTQADLVKAVLDAGAGRQVTLQELPQILLDLLENPTLRTQMSKNGLQLADSSRGSSHRTFEIIKNVCQ